MRTARKGRFLWPKQSTFELRHFSPCVPVVVVGAPLRFASEQWFEYDVPGGGAGRTLRHLRQLTADETARGTRVRRRWDAWRIVRGLSFEFSWSGVEKMPAEAGECPEGASRRPNGDASGPHNCVGRSASARRGGASRLRRALLPFRPTILPCAPGAARAGLRGQVSWRRAPLGTFRFALP